MNQENSLAHAEASPVGASRKPATSGWAVVGLVGAILFIPVVPLACATVALGKIRRSRGRVTGTGMAITALIIGMIQLGLLIAAVVVVPMMQQRGKAMSTSDPSARPLLVVPLASSASGRNPAFDPHLFAGKAIYLRIDQSVQQSRIDRSTHKVPLRDSPHTLFENGPDTIWDDDVPDVKPPR